MLLVVFGKQGFVARRADQRTPLLLHNPAGEVQAEPRIYVDESRDILRALDITAHPIKRIGDAAQHDLQDPRIFAAAALRGIHDQRTFLQCDRVSPPGRTKISFP